MIRRTLGLALAGALLVASGPPVAARPPRQDDAARGIAIASRSPWVGAEGTLRIDLATTGPVDPYLVQLRVHGAVDSMEDLEESVDGNPGPTLYRMPELPVGFLASQPDGSRRLELAVSDTESAPFTLRLRQPGIYPVTIELEDEAGEVVDSISTPLVRLGTPDDPLPAPDLALVVRLAAAPSIGPEGRRPLDDDELSRLRRLAALLDATGPEGGETAGLTVAASPDTLDALAASDDPRATAVLDSLAQAGDDRTALASPYVPLDVGALDDAGLEAFLPPLHAAGVDVLEDRLGPELDRTVWDSGDGLDDAAADLLADLGVQHVLVDAASPAATGSPAAERALVDAGPLELPAIDPLDAIVVDAATATSLAERATDRSDAAHLALAELILRDDGAESTVALVVDDVAEDSVLARLLPLLADPSSPVDVGPVVPGTFGDDDALGEDDPEAPELELDAARGSGDRSGLRDVAETVGNAWVAVDIFDRLVGAESARASELRLRIATSLARGLDREERAALLETVSETTRSTFDGVTLAGQTDVNLTSRRGTLPLVVRNDNPFPVQVVVRVRSERLRFPQGDRFEIDVAEELIRLDVPVESRATGSVPTFVEVLTPDEGLVLDERRLDVRSTAVSGVGLAISLGALLVLLVWWVRTWRRSRTARGGPDA